jgi:hypothetical protein
MFENKQNWDANKDTVEEQKTQNFDATKDGPETKKWITIPVVEPAGLYIKSEDINPCISLGNVPG